MQATAAGLPGRFRCGINCCNLRQIERASVSTVNFYDLTLEQLRESLTGLGKEKFRAQQLYQWVYQKGIENFGEMSNLSKVFRLELEKIFHFNLPGVVERVESRDGTTKLLLDVGDGQTVEAVLIPADERLTLCLSSEVGCNLACKFCYTGKRLLSKRLSVSQIVGQFLRATEGLPAGKRVTNIVFMGMGEPLDNPEAVFSSIQVLTEALGIKFPKKKITVSTSGLVPLIPLVTESGARLAVSLNGSNDEVRSAIMPINKKHPIQQLFDACRSHARETGNRVTFEYVLLKGVNDSVEHARELYRLTRSVPNKINLIPFNEHPEADFFRPSQQTVFRFKNELIRLGAHALVRKTMGRDIYAACGQLTSKFPEHPQRMPRDEFEKAGYSTA